MSVVGEDLLGAVAVVHVPVNDQDARRVRASAAVATAMLFSRQKPWPSSASGVMTRRAHGHERGMASPRSRASIAARPQLAASTAVSNEPRETRRVRIEMPASRGDGAFEQASRYRGSCARAELDAIRGATRRPCEGFVEGSIADAPNDRVDRRAGRSAWPRPVSCRSRSPSQVTRIREAICTASSRFAESHLTESPSGRALVRLSSGLRYLACNSYGRVRRSRWSTASDELGAAARQMHEKVTTTPLLTSSVVWPRRGQTHSPTGSLGCSRAWSTGRRPGGRPAGPSTCS